MADRSISGSQVFPQLFLAFGIVGRDSRRGNGYHDELSLVSGAGKTVAVAGYQKMNALIILFLVSLLLGQLAGISVAQGVTLYLHDFAAVAILVYGILTGAIRRSMTGSRLVKSIVAFTIVGVLSLLVNASLVPTTALWKGSLYLLRWVVYAGVYFALAGSLVSSVFLLRGLFLLGTGLAVAGLFQFVFYPDLRNLMYLGWDPHYYRVFSTLFDPNFSGILFVLTLIVGVYLFLQKKSIWTIGGNRDNHDRAAFDVFAKQLSGISGRHRDVDSNTQEMESRPVWVAAVSRRHRVSAQTRARGVVVGPGLTRLCRASQIGVKASSVFLKNRWWGMDLTFCRFCGRSLRCLQKRERA